MLTYLLELTVCWTLLYGVFYLCMRRETFFKINRWYLLSAILLGLVIPLLRFIPMVGEVELYNQQIAEYAPIVYVIKDAPAIVAHSISEQSIEWGQVFQFGLLTLYALGFAFFLFRFIKGLISIRRLYQEGEKSIAKNHTLINTSGNHLPFSFLNMIFVSKDLPLNEDYNRIITHELEHVRAWHSIDVLLLEIINIIFWFHPMIYLYKSALRQTHEYLADAAVCGIDSRQHYGQLLLRQSLSGLEIALAHHFFHSHIKKRINMIYQEKSGRKAWLKYALAVPALAVLMLVFTSQTTKVQEEKQQDQTKFQSSAPEFKNSNQLNEKQKKRLLSEVLKVFKQNSELSTLEKEQLVATIIKKWNKKYPKKKHHIQSTISYGLIKENLTLFEIKGKIIIKPIGLWLPNKEAIETYDMLSRSLPDIQELSDIIRRPPLSDEISVIRKYVSFQSYYSNGGQRKDEILELFEQCIKEENIQLGFKLKDIRLEFNITAPTLIKDYINSSDESALPVFWGQSISHFAPHHTNIDLNYPIGFFAYLSPSQAKTIFGYEGRKGLIAVSNYTLHPDHPEIQTERLTKDIDNFFSTIDQLPAKNWVKKLKEVSHNLKSKYPNARDFITPYSSISQQHNITLVFKDEEIIKAYRGDGNSTERIDTDPKVKFPQGSVKPSTPEEKLDINPNSAIKLSNLFIKSVFENFIVPEDLRSEGIEGAVIVLLNVNENNRVDSYKIAHSLDERLSRATENTIEKCKDIAVLKEPMSINPTQTYALNFIIEHNETINERTDSLLTIMKKDRTVHILDDMKLIYSFESSSDIKSNFPSKTKSSSDSIPDSSYIVGGLLGITKAPKDLALVVNGKHEKNPDENIDPNSVQSLKALSEEDALVKYPELMTKHIIEVSTKEKSYKAYPTDTLSPIQKTNLESYAHIDTVITYNPETFEETVQIRYSNNLPSFPGTINKKNRSYGYDGPVNVDTATIFDPVTFEESYVITTYPSHLSSDAPSVEIANFKYKIDKKNKLIYLSEITENISIGIISEEGNKHITFNKEIAASNTMTIDISTMPTGYYYISSLVGSVEVMKRIQIE